MLGGLVRQVPVHLLQRHAVRLQLPRHADRPPKTENNIFTCQNIKLYYVLPTVVVRARHLHLQPELEAVALLAAGGEDVVGGPPHLPLGPGQQLAARQGPGAQRDADGGGDEDAHVVGPHGTEQYLACSLALASFSSGSQVLSTCGELRFRLTMK